MDENGINNFVIKSKMDDGFYNIKSPPPPLVGAKCDGISDDTSPINTLIKFVSSSGGGTIIFPNKTIKANITINSSNVILIGSLGGNFQGKSGGTTIRPFDANKPIISVGDGVKVTSFIKLINLYLRGSSNSDGLVINGVNNLHVDGVNIFECKNNIFITSSITQSTSGIYLDNFTSYYAFENCLYAEWGTSWTTALYVNNYWVITDETRGNAIKLSGNVTLNTSNGYIDIVKGKGVILQNKASIQGNSTIIDNANKHKGVAISIDYPSTTPIVNFIKGQITINNGTIGFTDKQVDALHSGLLPDSMYSLYPKVLGSSEYFKQGDIDGKIHGKGSIYKDEFTNNMVFQNYQGGVTITPEDKDAHNLLVRKYNSTPSIQLMRNGGQAKISLDFSDPNNKRVIFSTDWGVNFQFPNDYGGNHLMIGVYHTWIDSGGSLRISQTHPKTETDGNKIIKNVPVPVTATSPGQVGDIAFDDMYLYVCIEPNKWKRMTIDTW